MTKAEIKERIKALSVGYWTKKELAETIGVRRQSLSVAFDELVNDGYISIVGIKGKSLRLALNENECVDACAIHEITSVEECDPASDLLKVKGTKLHTFYNRERDKDGKWNSYHKPFTMYIAKSTVDQLKEIKDSEVPFF